MGSREDLETLRDLVRREPAIDDGLDEYCVLLHDGGDAGEWADCPPRRGEMFARDGSEHEFCLLGEAVVLYSPLGDRPHAVVGADLREFLALLLSGNGAQIGGLGYDWDETVAELAAGSDDEISDSERRMLDRLVEVFGLRPWTDHGGRLAELQAPLSS